VRRTGWLWTRGTPDRRARLGGYLGFEEVQLRPIEQNAGMLEGLGRCRKNDDNQKRECKYFWRDLQGDSSNAFVA